MISKNGRIHMASYEWKDGRFHNVIDLPENYEVRDFSTGDYLPSKSEFDVGKYDEIRPGMYKTDLFGGTRTLHVGIDIGGPVGTPCMSFEEGEIAYFGYNPSDGDYGHVVVTRHEFEGKPIWALYGHLNSDSILEKRSGQNVKRGEVVGWIGDKHENGGWEPHLHFQLSWFDPMTHDMPGVVDPRDRAEALAKYPDPRIVLGPIY